MRPAYSLTCGLTTLLLTLACAGGDEVTPGASPPEIEFAPSPQPSEKQSAATGLAKELGFPVGKGTVKASTDAEVEVLYRAAYDSGVPFIAVKEHLENKGWVMDEVKMPPFSARFTKGDDSVRVVAEAAGSSVWIRARRP